MLKIRMSSKFIFVRCLIIQENLQSQVLLPPSKAPWTRIEKSTVLVHVSLAWKTIIVIATLSAMSDNTRFLIAMISTMGIIASHLHFTISNGWTADVKVFDLDRIFDFMFFSIRNFSLVNWQTTNFTSFTLKIYWNATFKNALEMLQYY